MGRLALYTSTQLEDIIMHDNVIATALVTSSPRVAEAHSTVELAPIYITASSKGGTGKSMSALALIDALLETEEKILFIESDTANPDVYRCLARDDGPTSGEALPGVVMQTLKLDEREGWMELVNLVDAHRDRVVVINGAARLGDAVQKYGAILQESLPELGRRFITLWLLNRQRDAMDQLREHMAVFPGSTFHVVRNGLFGEEAKFELYNSSRLRAQIESNGGKSLTLPDLADRVADALYTQRLAISDAIARMPLGNRIELQRWRKEAHRVLDAVLA
jgi:hypothetical protein